MKVQQLFHSNLEKSYAKEEKKIVGEEKYQSKLDTLNNTKKLKQNYSYVDLKNRKNSWNPEIPSFLKKPGRKNSD